MNLNIAPYFDDYNPTKKYTRILAVPGRAAQAREITQLQTMSRDMLARFGNTFYKNGVVIQGGFITVNLTDPANKFVYISPSQVYYDGLIIDVDAVTIPITGTGLERIGLYKKESIVTELEDNTLQDPALGYDPLEQAGAHRLKEEVVWVKLPSSEAISPVEIYALQDGERIVIPLLTSDLDISNKSVSDISNLGSIIMEGFSFTLEPKDDFYNYLTISPGKGRLLGKIIEKNTSFRTLIPISRHMKLYEKETIQIGDVQDYYEFNRKPVANVSNVRIVVTETNKVFRDSVLNSGDNISPNLDDEILSIEEVTQDGYIFEQFNGKNQKTFSYRLVNDRIVWEGSGPEPLPNSLYNIKYKIIRPLTKQLVERTLVEFEPHHILGDNVLTNDLIIDNSLVSYFVTRVNTENIGEEDIYRYGKDFTVDYESKEIVWDNYDFYKLDIIRNASSLKDVLLSLDITKNYAIDIINVGGFYDTQNNIFVEGTNIHPSEYTFMKENDQYIIRFNNNTTIAPNTVYYVVVREITPKSSHRPIGPYYVSYGYWKEVVFGDYRTVDSYYNKYTEDPITHIIDPTKTEQCLDDFPSKQYMDFRLTNGFKPVMNSEISFDYNVYMDICIAFYLRRDGDIVAVPGNPSLNAEPLLYSPEHANALYLGHIYCYANSKDMDYIQSNNREVRYSKVQDLSNRLEVIEKTVNNSEIDLPFETLDIPNKTSVYIEPFKDYRKVDLNYSYKTINSRYAIDYYNSSMTIPGSYSIHRLGVNTDGTTATTYTDKLETSSEGWPLKVGLPEAGNGEILKQEYYSGDESIISKEDISPDILDRSQFFHIEVNPKIIQFSYPKNIYSNTSFDKKDIFKGSILSGMQNINFYFTKSLLNQDMQSIDAAMGYDNSIINTNQLSDFLYSYCPEGYEVTFRIPSLPFDEALEWRVFFGGVSVNVSGSGDLLWGTADGTDLIKPSRIGNSNYGQFKGSFKIPSGISAGVVPLMVLSSPITVNNNSIIYKCITYINCSNFVAEDEYGRMVKALKYVEDNAINLSNDLILSTLKANNLTWYTKKELSESLMAEKPFGDYQNDFWDSRKITLNGTLCQTFQPFIDDHYLKSVSVEFTSKNSKNSGVFCKVVNVKDGYPIPESSDLGHNISYLSNENIPVNTEFNSGIPTTFNKAVFKFNPPCYLSGTKTHGILFYPDYKFNLQAVTESDNYGDIRLRIGTLGNMDLPSQTTSISNPYRYGDLYKSQLGISWEKYEDTDIKFEMEFFKFNNTENYYIQWKPLTVENINSFYFLCSFERHPLTKIVFQYRYLNSDWIEFEPNNLVRLENITSYLEFRAILSSDSPNVSPFVYIQDVTVASFTPYRVATYITKEVALNNDSNTIDIYFNAGLPDTSKFRVFFEIGNSGVFNQFSNSNVPWLEYVDNLHRASLVGDPVYVGTTNDVAEYRYHYLLSITELFKSFRIMIILDYFYESYQMPYISDLAIISSREVDNTYFSKIYKGTGTFNSQDGVVVALPEVLLDTNYSVNIIPTAEPIEMGNLGEYYISEKTKSSFTVKNTGGDNTTTFDWLIVY